MCAFRTSNDPAFVRSANRTQCTSEGEKAEGGLVPGCSGVAEIQNAPLATGFNRSVR